jgi:hypothetical protein
MKKNKTHKRIAVSVGVAASLELSEDGRLVIFVDPGTILDSIDELVSSEELTDDEAEALSTAVGLLAEGHGDGEIVL